MPVPTDTFWNIKLLNRAFAASSIILVVIMLWSVLQDYDKSWRQPQKSNQIWQAALTRDKMDRVMSKPEKKKLAELAAFAQKVDDQVKSGKIDFQGLDQQAQQLEKTYSDQKLLTSDEKKSLDNLHAALTDPQKQQALKNVKPLDDQIGAIDSKSSSLTFENNNRKSRVVVTQTAIERTRTEGHKEQAEEMERKLEPEKKEYEQAMAQLGDWKRQTEKLKEDRTAALTDVDGFHKLVKKEQESYELLEKKLFALQPPSAIGKASEIVRDAPLMDFMNRAQQVKQVVLPDILSDFSFTKTETTDRCATCHVNIDNKDYTQPKILAFLEEQLAMSRKAVALNTSQEDREFSLDRPELCGMPEFWHTWAVKLAPEVVEKNASSLDTLAASIGKISVKQNSAAVAAADKYTALPSAQRDLVTGALLVAWELYEQPQKDQSWKLTVGNVAVEIPANVPQETLNSARDAAFAYTAAARKAVEDFGNDESKRTLNDRYRFALIGALNPLRKRQGYAALDPSAAILAHPRLDLYADPDSKHPMDKIGCTSCHDGSGQETSFVLAAHTARDIFVDQETGEPVLPQQVVVKNQQTEKPDLTSMLDAVVDQMQAEGKLALTFDDLAKGAKPAPHPEAQLPEPSPNAPAVDYVDPVTGKTRKAVAQEKYWADKYEAESGTTFESVHEMWDWPMRTPKYLQANCARCHSNIHDIRDEAPVLYEGRVMFAKLGCVNCHQMDSIPADEGSRKVGPDLRHVKDKLSKAFIESWVWAPKAFRPSTLMPHFFMLENSSSPEELRRTQQEVRAIATYLTETATPTPTSPILADPKNKMPALPEDDDKLAEEIDTRAERGRQIFLGDTESSSNTEKEAGVGCIACHTNLNETGLKWISLDLTNSPEFVEQVKQKNKGKTPTRSDLTKAARAKYDAMSYNERQLYALTHFTNPLGQLSIPTYPNGDPRPVFQRHAPELSGIGTKLLAGGRTKAQAIGWLYGWVMDPRHYSEQTVMPRLRLSPEEAMDLACYLLKQTRKAKEKNDTWKATEIAADPDKVNDLVAMFLFSQFDEGMARKKAVETDELKKLAKIALKNKFNTDKEVADRVEKMTDEQRQLVFLGSKLITHYGCMNCHAINGMEGAASPCTNLSDWGQKREDKLDFGFLAEHKVKEELPETADFYLVNGLSPDALTKITPRLGNKDFEEPLSRMVEVKWPLVPHGRASWLEHKLKNSRIYDRGKNLLEPVRDGGDAKPKLVEAIDPNGNDLGYKVPALLSHGKPYDKLRMPTFYLEEAQVHAIVTFVISNRDKLVTQKMLDNANPIELQRIAKGRQLADKFNCIGCHRLEFNQPFIQQYFLKGTGYWDAPEMSLKAPPNIHGEGSRVQQQWLFNFLKHVEQAGTGPQGKMRPQPYVRMPSFPLTDEEATAIAAYFGADVIKEGKDLAKRFDPLMKDLAKSINPESPDSVNLETAWPDDNWWKDPKYAALVDFVRDYAIRNGSLREQDFAASNDDKTLAQTYMTALFDVRFLRSAWNTMYPFVDVAHPTPSEERFKKGELLFHYLNCQQCHVIGREADQLTQQERDAKLTVNAAPKGPNLRLAFGKLQRHWAYHWVQQTDVIQPGSAMPPIFFSGRAIPALNDKDGRVIYSLPGLPHLTASPTPELVKQLQYNFGQTVEEQKELLLDFVFAAGVRGYTSFDPPLNQPVAIAPMPKDFKAEPIPGITAPLPEKKNAAPVKTAPAPTQPVPQVVQTGPSIVGTVVFDGTPPARKSINIGGVPQCAALHPTGLFDDSLVVAKDGGVQDVVVWVKNGPPGPVPPPAQLDQKGCMYSPHILPVMKGQRITVSNSDPFQHNIHGLPENNASFNFPQNGNDPGKLADAGATRAVEMGYTVKCDIHPWMNSRVVVLPNPYFAKTDENGKFTINNLPPGTYTVTTWHEKCAPIEQQVKVEAGKPAQINLKVKMGE